MKSNFGCPVQGTINVLAGKWKVLAIWHLGFGPRRFAELRKLLRKAGFRGIATSVVHREAEAPHFETMLAVAEKPALGRAGERRLE